MRPSVFLQRTLCFWCLGVVTIVSGASAQQASETLPEESKSRNNFSEQAAPGTGYEDGGSFYLGFKWVEIDDVSIASEYVEDESSLVLGVDTIGTPLPHRYHMHGEYLGEHDYYGDIGYAYKDLLLFRNVIVGVHHNLDHYYYLYPGQPPSVMYEDRSIGDNNSVDFQKNDMLLRLKAPDFPIHAFLKHRFVERNGDIEERFLTGRFGNLVKTSQSRSIDWESKDLTVWMNSHLGPVEVEFAHTLGDLDPGDQNVLYDYYPRSFVFGRPADTYPHNVVPETETWGNSLKLHTSYTGQVVASATLSNTENTNNYSNTEMEVWKAAFDLRWIPDPVISLFFKYRHREQDKENPNQVTLNGLANRITYPVRPLISTKKDFLSLSARYRPWRKVTLLGSYNFTHLERTDLYERTVLPEDSDNHHLNLSAHIRPLDTLTLKGIYDFENKENPSYNTEPDHLNKVRLNVTYTPTSWLTAFVDYKWTYSQRDDLEYINSNPFLILQDGEREGRTDNFLGSLSFVFSPEVSLTVSWAYNRWKIEQDLTYALWNTSGPGGDLPYYDRSVPYEDEANIFMFSLYYMLREDITLTADLSYMIAEGEYMPGDIIAGDPTAFARFSSVETTQTVATIELAKKLNRGWEIGLKFQADIYNDKFSEDTGDHQDGELYISVFSLKRYF